MGDHKIISFTRNVPDLHLILGIHQCQLNHNIIFNKGLNFSWCRLNFNLKKGFSPSVKQRDKLRKLFSVIGVSIGLRVSKYSSLLDLRIAYSDLFIETIVLILFQVILLPLFLPMHSVYYLYIYFVSFYTIFGMTWKFERS